MCVCVCVCDSVSVCLKTNSEEDIRIWETWNYKLLQILHKYNVLY
jgi:hypothetical protein